MLRCFQCQWIRIDGAKPVDTVAQALARPRDVRVAAATSLGATGAVTHQKAFVEETWGLRAPLAHYGCC